MYLYTKLFLFSITLFLFLYLTEMFFRGGYVPYLPLGLNSYLETCILSIFVGVHSQQVSTKPSCLKNCIYVDIDNMSVVSGDLHNLVSIPAKERKSVSVVILVLFTILMKFREYTSFFLIVDWRSIIIQSVVSLPIHQHATI